MERKFLVLLRRFRLRNEHFHYIICGSLELFISPSLRRYEARRLVLARIVLEKSSDFVQETQMILSVKTISKWTYF